MHLSTLILVAVSSIAAARPQFVDPAASPATATHRIVPVLNRQEIRDDAGQYSLAFQSGDGAAQSSYGVLRPNADGKGHFLAVTGSYSYTAPDGTPIYVKYIADENGFHVEGDHIPKQVTDTA